MRQQGFRAHLIPARLNLKQELQWMLSHAKPGPDSLVILDILDLPVFYVQSLKATGAKVIAFENQRLSNRLPDISINAIVDGPQATVIRTLGGFLLRGAPFRIFNPDYRKIRRRPQRLITTRKKGRLLISLGGGTDFGLLGELIEQLLKLRLPLEIIAVRGPAAVKAADKNSIPGVRILPAQRSLAKWIEKADLAITAGGGTLYELAYAGVPSVAFAKKKHQLRNIRYFEKLGTVISAGFLNRRNLKSASEEIKRLLMNQRRRRLMAEASMKVVDGKGLERVMTIINVMLTGETIDYGILGTRTANYF